MMSQTIHYISKINIGEIVESEFAGKPFYTRDITIHQKGKKAVNISCFSDDKESLKIKISKTDLI